MKIANSRGRANLDVRLNSCCRSSVHIYRILGGGGWKQIFFKKTIHPPPRTTICGKHEDSLMAVLQATEGWLSIVRASVQKHCRPCSVTTDIYGGQNGLFFLLFFDYYWHLGDQCYKPQKWKKRGGRKLENLWNKKRKINLFLADNTRVDNNKTNKAQASRFCSTAYHWVAISKRENKWPPNGE